MHRLETSTTQVNAAWDYLLENKKSFSTPVKEINAFNLRQIVFRQQQPKPTPKIRVKNTVKIASLKERVKQKISEIF